MAKPKFTIRRAARIEKRTVKSKEKSRKKSPIMRAVNTPTAAAQRSLINQRITLVRSVYSVDSIFDSSNINPPTDACFYSSKSSVSGFL